MQMLWYIKIAKPNGNEKGCSILDASQNVTVKVEFSQENVPPKNEEAKSYFAQFDQYGLLGFRTHNMEGYYVTKDSSDPVYKYTEKALQKTLTPMGIIGISKDANQGTYVSGTLKASNSVYSFEIKPKNNLTPGTMLTSGEFLLYSEQPATTAYKTNSDGEPVYLGEGESPVYEIVAQTKSISGYAQGVSSPITRTFGTEAENSTSNTIEGGGGYHSHIWLVDRSGANISGSSYYSTSGIGAYNKDFSIKQYEYYTYSSREIENDAVQVTHARKTWITWDNRYVDIDVAANGKLNKIELTGQLARWEKSTASNWATLGQGKTLNNTKMVFITKADGSAWSNDTEQYTINLLPNSSSNSLKFYNTYIQAANHGRVCGVVIENFDFKLDPDVRNYLGIIFGMKFRGNDEAIGKTLGFTETTIGFHKHKGCKRKTYVRRERDIDRDGVYTPRETNPTLGASDGNSAYDIRDHIDYMYEYFNGSNKNGSQIMWINGAVHKGHNDPVKLKVAQQNIIVARKYRPTNWVDGVATGLNGYSHPHCGNSMFVMGDTNKVEAKCLIDNSITDILKLASDADKLKALNKRNPSAVNDLSAAGRITFAINPMWSSKNKTSDRPAKLFIPTALLKAGKGNARKIVSEKEDTGAIMEYLYASKKDSAGKATSIPVRVTPGNTYNVKDFVDGSNIKGTFTVTHVGKSNSAMEKYMEQDNYCGNPYSGRTVYILSGNNAITVSSKGAISLSAKSAGNEYQQWKVVKHPTGAFGFVNVATNYELDNGKVYDENKYGSSHNVSTHKYSSTEDSMVGAFNITGALDSATIKTCIGGYTLVNSGGVKVSESGSTKWNLESINTGDTTGYIVEFENLQNDQNLPLFFVEYFIDKTELDASQVILQKAYIVENNPGIDVSGDRSATASVSFVDLRTGVIKETVNVKKALTRELKSKKTLITYTMTFNNIFDDQRYMRIKCKPPFNNDENGTQLPAGCTIAVLQDSLTKSSSLGTEDAEKFSVAINEADGAIYANGIMEPSEVVTITYTIKVYGMADTAEGYIRNNCTLILEKVVNAKGDAVIDATDANKKKLSDREGFRVDSNRVQTYFSDRDIPTTPEPDNPPPPDTPITTITVTPITPTPGVGKSVNRVSNNVGEDHTWTVKTEIPPRGDYPTDWHYEYDQDGYEIARWREDADLTSYTITDDIDSRLDYRGNLKVLLNGSDITSSCTITKPSVNFAGGPIRVSIQNASLLERMASEGGYITLMYNTRINPTAQPGFDNRIYNQATRSYTGVKHSRGGSSSWSGSNTTNKPYVYTGETEVRKYNVLNNDDLKGAVISIYTADGHIVRRRSEYPVNYGDEGYDSLTEDYLVRTDDEGIAYFYGLKDGTYYFREVSPPRGFEWNKNNSDRTTISIGEMGADVGIPNNPYQATTVEKTVDKNEWLTHEIHTWTVTGHIPQYFTDEEYAACQYQFIDEIDYQELDITKKRLDYRGNVKVFVAGSEMRKDYHYSVQEDSVFDSTTGRQRVIKLTVTMLPPGITAISDAAKNGGWQTNTVVLQFDTSINERAREHEIIPNRVELNYCGFGVRRYAKSDLRIVPSENPLDVWDWDQPDTPGYPHEFGEPGGHLVKQDPSIAEEKDEWLIDDPYVYTGYRVLKINCIIDQKYDPYEDISFTYDIDGYPCYDKTKKLHWTVIINPTMDGENIEATVWDSMETVLYRSKAKFGNDVLIYLPPGTYTVNQRKPMRYDLVESKPEVENAYKVPGSFAIENNLIPYHDAEDTFINVLRQWNMHSSAYLETNEPGLREKLRGYLNIVLINGPKDVTVTSIDTGETVFSDTVANAHCIKIDYGEYEISVGGDVIEVVNLQQYSMQRRYILAED
jgi:fimbrial isopeptide formation D2 family protein